MNHRYGAKLPATSKAWRTAVATSFRIGFRQEAADPPPAVKGNVVPLEPNRPAARTESKGPPRGDPAGENLIGMKSSPGKRQHRIFHTTFGFRTTTVIPYRNRDGAKKPQTGAGWLRLFRAPECRRQGAFLDCTLSARSGISQFAMLNILNMTTPGHRD